jgi:putative acyl-CoA dehydrogenase
MNQSFFQKGPETKNTFRSDRLLQNLLEKNLSKDHWQKARSELDKLGERCATDLQKFSEDAEKHPPNLVSFDPWGKRIDEIEVSEGWKKLEHAAATEGIVATGYEREFGEHSRLVQFAKLYLYHPSSAFFSCPLAMTDGAARAIELFGNEEMKARAFKNLTSRDPKKFWTSGQWMTERSGGSDVSGTETIAIPMGGDRYELHGTKWFTSATTSQMAMTLARIQGHPAGSKGLSLFYLELRDAHGKLNKIEVHRLKDKLGTKALPTAELSLVGTPATLVGGEGNGVKKIASLFNITRMYNSVCALGATRRVLSLAMDYSKKRLAFGKLLIDLPLHRETLSDLAVEFEGNFHLTFSLAELLGKEEMGLASAEESAMLRMLTPIAKLYTAKSCQAITSEALEMFGGAGYVEDVGISRYYRDAQVFSIWEGATNVLSMDVLRAIEKENAFLPFVQGIEKRLQRVSPAFSSELSQVKQACEEIKKYLPNAVNLGGDFVQEGARKFAFSLARTFAASHLLACAEEGKPSGYAARKWCKKGLIDLHTANSSEGKSEFLDSVLL